MSKSIQTIDTHYDFNVPAEKIWDLLADFGNIERWWPKSGPVNIERVELEGEGIGLTRHIYNEGFESAVSERLDAIDPQNRTYQLSIVGDRPAGLLEYMAQGRLSDLDNGGCRLAYHSEFTTEPGRDEEARQFLLGAYQLMFDGLAQATRG